MKWVQELWTSSGQAILGRAEAVPDAELVLGFGAPARLSAPETWQRLREQWPRARIVMCSTAGEISGTQVFDDSLALTALRFERTPLRCAEVVLRDGMASAQAGHDLVQQLLGPGLRHVFVLSDSLKINGSELVAGMTTALPAGVSLTGGLSGDGDRFQRTYVCLDRFDELPRVAAIGFYGDLTAAVSSPLSPTGWRKQTCARPLRASSAHSIRRTFASTRGCEATSTH